MLKSKGFTIILLVLSLFILFNTNIYSEEINTLKEPIWVYYGRGNRYFHNKNYGYALAEYKKALQKINKIMETEGKTNPYYPDITLKIAEIYFIEKLYNESLYYLDITLKNSELFRIKDRIFTVLYMKANCYLKLNKIDLAIKTFFEIINKDDNWKIYKILKITDIPDPIDSPEKRKKFGKAYYTLGLIKYNSGNYENAIVYLKMSFLYLYRLNNTLDILKRCYSIIGYDFITNKLEEKINKYENYQ